MTEKPTDPSVPPEPPASAPEPPPSPAQPPGTPASPAEPPASRPGSPASPTVPPSGPPAGEPPPSGPPAGEPPASRPPAGEPPASGPPPGGPPPEEPDRPAGIPWEQRDRLGWWNGLTQTVRLSLFQPTEFFRNMPPDGPIPAPPAGPLGSALLYAIIIEIPAVIVGLIWQTVFAGANLFFGEGSDALFDLGTSVIFAFMTPIIVPIVLVIGAAIIHLLLMILGGANRSFLATFRVVCYSSAPWLLEILPLCGSLIGFVWWIVLVVIGLTSTHRTTWPRALAALALPWILCCGFFLIAMFGMAIIGKGLN